MQISPGMNQNENEIINFGSINNIAFNIYPKIINNNHNEQNNFPHSLQKISNDKTNLSNLNILNQNSQNPNSSKDNKGHPSKNYSVNSLSTKEFFLKNNNLERFNTETAGLSMVNEDPLTQSQSAKNVLLSARVIKNKNKLLKEDRGKILNFANYIKNQRPLEDNIDILSSPNMIMNQPNLNQQEQNQCKTPNQSCCYG